MQEYTAALQLVLPRRYAASSHAARWAAALAAGVSAARALAAGPAGEAPAYAPAGLPQLAAAWALTPDQAPAAAAAGDALADWRARVRALEEGGRAAEAMQGVSAGLGTYSVNKVQPTYVMEPATGPAQRVLLDTVKVGVC